MTGKIIRHIAGLLFIFTAIFSISVNSFAQDKEYPDKPDPPRLVNDYAHLLSTGENEQLERKLEDFANSTSTQITVVTMSNLGGHDISEYSVHIFNDWGLGQSGKNNGVLMLVALDDGYGKRKAWITVGRGLQGVLTDAKSGQIFRNQMVPAFKNKEYYRGLSDAADAVIAVTKGEYTASEGDRHHEPHKQKESGKGAPFIIIIIIILIIIFSVRNRGGGGGGGYRRRSGLGDLATGMILGNLLGGGFRGGNNGGGGDGGFGGFGGFGGGSTDGGGAGGSW